MTESEHWDMDDPVNIEGVDPEEALRVLLNVDLNTPEVDDDD